jgi:hypothetical protein
MTDFGSPPASYPVITSGSLLEYNQLDYEASHSAETTAKVYNT